MQAKQEESLVAYVIIDLVGEVMGQYLAATSDLFIFSNVGGYQV